MHWQASCAVNRLLFGDRAEPLCSRVYRQPPSLWRSVYLFAADLTFKEYRHCWRVNRDWQRSTTS